ncbi:hypothetical protein [Rheinheimera sp.]|uniref:hypothetical protein n=1 Tax=Rheinheimera sp. TaxID=1869214 RepID=UPI00307D246B
MTQIVSVSQHKRTKLPLLSHNIENESPVFILTIKNVTGWHHKLPVYRIWQLWSKASGLGQLISFNRKHTKSGLAFSLLL